MVLGGYLHIIFLMCTQCSILLHLIDFCFLPCIRLWQISQINPCLCVVVLTSLAFMRRSVRHPAGPRGWLAKIGKSGLNHWGWEVSTQFAWQFVIAVTAPPLVVCVVWSPTTCRLCCLESFIKCNHSASDPGSRSSDGFCGTDRMWWVQALSGSAGGFVSSGVTEYTKLFPDFMHLFTCS